MNQTSISYPSISQGIAWFNYYFFQSTVVLFLSGFQMEIVAFCTSKMSQGHPAPGSGAGGKGKGQQPVLCSRNRAALLNDVPNLGKCRATRVLLGPELLPGIAWCCVEKVCSSEIVPHPSQNTWNVLFSNSYMLKKKKKKSPVNLWESAENWFSNAWRHVWRVASWPQLYSVSRAEFL